MRVFLSTYGSRGDVEPMVGLAVQLQALGTEMPVYAPPDFAEPLAPVGQLVRLLVTGVTPPTAAGLPRRVAEGSDARISGGVMPRGGWL